MNFLGMQNAVMQDRFDSTKYRERVKGWLNDGAGRIARRADLPSMQEVVTVNTIIGQAEYDLPVDFARQISLLPLDFPELGALEFIENPVEVKRMRGDIGRPEVYSIERGKILLGPVPDAVYPLEQTYQRLAERMVEDTDECELPEDYHDLLPTFATSRGYRSEEDREMADAWMADFENDFARLRVDLRHETLDGPVQVPGTF